MTTRPSRFPLAFYLGLGTTLLLFFGLQALFPTLPLYILQIGGTATDNGLATWAFALASVLVRPFAGSLADRRGGRLMLVAGALLFGGAPLLYLVSHTVPALLAARAAHGAGMALFSVTYTALAVALSPPERRGEGLGLASAASTVATAVAPLVGEGLVALGNFSLLFVVLGGLGLVAACGAVLLPPLPPAPQTRSPLGGMRQVLAHRRVRVVSAEMALMGLPFGMLIGFLPLLAQERGFGSTGWAFAAYALTCTASGPLAGRLSDRLGRRWAILPGAIAATLATLGLAFVGNRWGMVGLATLYGLGWCTMRAGLDAQVQDAVAPDQRAGAVAAQYTAFDLGVGAGSWALGALASAHGCGAGFAVAAGAAFLAFLLLMVEP